MVATLAKIDGAVKEGENDFEAMDYSEQWVAGKRSLRRC